MHILVLFHPADTLHPMKHSIFTIWGLTAILSFLTHETGKYISEWQVFWLTLILQAFPMDFSPPSVARIRLICKMFHRASQQRDCPGVTPDSLLIFLRWPRISNQFGRKYRKLLNKANLFCTKVCFLCNPNCESIRSGRLKCHLFNGRLLLTDYTSRKSYLCLKTLQCRYLLAEETL